MAALRHRTRSTCCSLSGQSSSTIKQHDPRRLSNCVSQDASHAPGIPSALDALLWWYSSEFREPRWRALLPAACCSILFHAGTLHVPSASWRSSLGAATWALTALGTWWKRHHNAVAGKRVRINDCERSARRQLCISTADSWTAAAARWTWSADGPRPNDKAPCSPANTLMPSPPGHIRHLQLARARGRKPPKSFWTKVPRCMEAPRRLKAPRLPSP